MIQVIKGATFEFITRRIARKAVDWHHSELDEIITGAICARHGREKAASLTYKTRGSWKSKKKKKRRMISREDIEWPSSKHVNHFSLRTPWNCETNDKTIELYCAMFYRDFFGPREPRTIAWRTQSKRARRFLLWDKVVYGLILIRRGWYHGRPHAFPLISIMGQLKAVNESGVVNRWMRAHLCLTGLSLFFPPSYFILLAMRPIDDTLVAMSPTRFIRY